MHMRMIDTRSSFARPFRPMLKCHDGLTALFILCAQYLYVGLDILYLFCGQSSDRGLMCPRHDKEMPGDQRYEILDDSQFRAVDQDFRIDQTIG